MAMVAGVVSRSRPTVSRGQGFSLVEALVSALLLLITILGMVPLFMRSIISNTGGSDYSRLSNFSKSKVEELFQLDFTNAQLTIPPGQTEITIDEYWSDSEKKWKPGAVPSGTSTQWTRSTLVRQYNISAVDKTTDSFDFEKAEALDGNAAAGSVHLKELVVTVRSMRRGALGPQRDLVLRTLKAK